MVFKDDFQLGRHRKSAKKTFSSPMQINSKIPTGKSLITKVITLKLVYANSQARIRLFDLEDKQY